MLIKTEKKKRSFASQGKTTRNGSKQIDTVCGQISSGTNDQDVRFLEPSLVQTPVRSTKI